MKFILICCLVLLSLSVMAASAQTPAPSPARPADPNQPLPPPLVAPNPLPPATPAPAAASATNAPGTTASPVSLAIIADSSLRGVLQELAQSWADAQDSSPQVPLTLTNAATLRSKVDAGSVWDLVISADIEDVQEMTTSGQLVASGQRSLARNTLVVYGRSPLIKDDEPDWFDLVGSEWKKVSLGNPDLVASGRVARRALQKHGLADDDHKGIYVYAPTETLALDVAQREESDAVFAYQTDVNTIHLPGFQVFFLKTEDAPPVFYTAAVCRAAKNPELARSFIDYCESDAGKEIWKKYGFETN